MGVDTTQVNWLEPSWSIGVSRQSFRRLFVSKGGGRCLVLVAIPCVPFLFAAYLLGLTGLAENRKLIFVVIGVLVGPPFALTAMEYSLRRLLKLPRAIFIQDGIVIIDYQKFLGELSQIELDQAGHQWLIVQNRFGRTRVGIDESVSASSILSGLNGTSETA